MCKHICFGHAYYRENKKINKEKEARNVNLDRTKLHRTKNKDRQANQRTHRQRRNLEEQQASADS